MADDKLIYLTDEEKDTLWIALAAAKLSFEEQPADNLVAKERLARIEQLFKLINYTEEVAVKLRYDRLETGGMQELAELVRLRKQREKDKARVIQFPGND